MRTGAHVGVTPVAVHLALNGQQYGPQAAAPYEYLVDDPSLHYGLSPYGTPSPPPPPPHLFGYKQGLDILGQAGDGTWCRDVAPRPGRGCRTRCCRPRDGRERWQRF